MPETIEPQAENTVQAKETKVKPGSGEYCRLVREYDGWLEGTRNKGATKREIDHILDFLDWLLVVKEAELKIKDQHGEI